MPNIVVYLTPLCPYCTRARRLLDGKGVGYTVINVAGDDRLWEEMTGRSHRYTVPQIFVDDLHIGGFDDMAALDADGKLDSLLGLTIVKRIVLQHRGAVQVRSTEGVGTLFTVRLPLRQVAEREDADELSSAGRR